MRPGAHCSGARRPFALASLSVLALPISALLAFWVGHFDLLGEPLTSIERANLVAFPAGARLIRL